MYTCIKKTMARTNSIFKSDFKIWNIASFPHFADYSKIIFNDCIELYCIDEP